MNGYDILTLSARLIGIERLDEGIKMMGLSLLNATLDDMGFMPLSSLSEDTGLPTPTDRQTLIFGTSMLLANALGDSDGREAMGELYSRRAATKKGGVRSLRDVMPKGEW